MKFHTLPSGGTLAVLSRDDWGGGPVRRGRETAPHKIHGLVMHHIPELPAAFGLERPPLTASNSGPPWDLSQVQAFMRRLQEIRPDLGSEVPYSWVVFRGWSRIDAIICEGHGAFRTGAHTARLNSTRYGIAFAQNTGKVPVDPGQIEAVRWLAGSLGLARPISPTTGHGDHGAISSLNRTECPGAGARLVLDQLQPPFNEATEAPEPLPEGPEPRRDPLPVLFAGDTGAAVREWQLLLNVLLELIDRSQGRPDSSRLFVTGTMDRQTVSLTRSFQTYAGIEVDGIVGNLETRPAMWRTLAVASASAIRREFGLAAIRPHPNEFGALAQPWIEL